MDSGMMIQALREHPAAGTFGGATAGLQNRVKLAEKLSGEEKRLRLEEAAREFEAIFVTYLLKVMRETMEDSGLTGEGMGKTVYTELFDQELARTVSNTGAFGIADLLVQRVMTQEKMQEDPAAEKLDAAEPSASRHLDRPEPSAARSVLRVDGKPVVPEFRMPIQAPVSSEFGIREDPFTRKPKFHRGIDISAPRGTPVQAALGGRVLFAGFSKGYGNTVVVEHGEGYRTRYAHLGSLKVTKGDVLETEQVLGTVGSTGRSTGPHLHFEVSRYGEKIDPRTALAE